MTLADSILTYELDQCNEYFNRQKSRHNPKDHPTIEQLRQNDSDGIQVVTALLIAQIRFNNNLTSALVESVTKDVLQVEIDDFQREGIEPQYVALLSNPDYVAATEEVVLLKLIHYDNLLAFSDKTSSHNEAVLLAYPDPEDFKEMFYAIVEAEKNAILVLADDPQHARKAIEPTDKIRADIFAASAITIYTEHSAKTLDFESF